MNSDAIEGTRILSQKHCFISSSNNSLKITKFSKNKSKPWEKINIKTKSFVKQITRLSYFCITIIMKEVITSLNNNIKINFSINLEITLRKNVKSKFFSKFIFEYL